MLKVRVVAPRHRLIGEYIEVRAIDWLTEMTLTWLVATRPLSAGRCWVFIRLTLDIVDQTLDKLLSGAVRTASPHWSKHVWVKHSASVKGVILTKVQDRKLNSVHRKPRPLWVRLRCSSNQSIWATLKGPVAWQLSHHFQVWHLSSVAPTKNSIALKEIAHLVLCLQLGFSRQSNVCVWKGDKTRLLCHSVICTVYIFG